MTGCDHLSALSARPVAWSESMPPLSAAGRVRGVRLGTKEQAARIVELALVEVRAQYRRIRLARELEFSRRLAVAEIMPELAAGLTAERP